MVSQIIFVPRFTNLPTKPMRWLEAMGFHFLEDHMNHDNDNAPDLLLGANAIATFLGVTRRQAYRLMEDGIIPSFHCGGSVAARRTSLRKWLVEAEQAGRTGAAA